MTADDIRNLAIEILADIAPDTNPSALCGDEDVRDALDIDSLDFLNFVTALNMKTGIPIPEKDYPRLFTLNGVVHYLGGK
ncbi:MAG: acyl carrier protein [Beijerinckiaceae bacterium]